MNTTLPLKIKVLVVDDSIFFQKRISELLSQDPELEVIGKANDGEDAIQKTKMLDPDVITMDVNMPVLDGISSVKKIMSVKPTPIIMLSSLTHKGAKETLEALDAGALDFIAKSNDLSKIDELKNKLFSSIKLVAKRKAWLSRKTAALETNKIKLSKNNNKIQVVLIGTSTGGPMALQNVITKLPKNFPVPVIMIQHMPATFTKAFAERMTTLGNIPVKEASDGDLLEPGHGYVAPGGKQLIFTPYGHQTKISVFVDQTKKQLYNPSVDVTFLSAANVYRQNALGIILTGMGSDGKEGCKALKEKGNTIWVQNEASCVVYGMPSAAVEAGVVDEILDINEIGIHLTQTFC